MGKICHFHLLCRVVATDDRETEVGAGLFKPATKVQIQSASLQKDIATSNAMLLLYQFVLGKFVLRFWKS